eukprot:CAMPEP_0113646500 /NCGR_PEP_ID=MMETSP0017_2-20120614/24565_1 /TAXON_ID=2856 /ORGANISM="Cylindrotheca closterium" /LENGTH=64 /DNA_ID=CAMNT_0000558403 /DNA_START=61 /DNA_END=255 /DNA_ORIENTATION=- /assembly_acc=CAM_ASM_000147
MARAPIMDPSSESPTPNQDGDGRVMEAFKTTDKPLPLMDWRNCISSNLSPSPGIDDVGPPSMIL